MKPPKISEVFIKNNYFLESFSRFLSEISRIFSTTKYMDSTTTQIIIANTIGLLNIEKIIIIFLIDSYDSCNHMRFYVLDLVQALDGEVCSALTVWDLASTADCDGELSVWDCDVQVRVCDIQVLVQVCDNSVSDSMTHCSNHQLYVLHNC